MFEGNQDFERFLRSPMIPITPFIGGCHWGYFCNKLLPGFPWTYLFSKLLNPLDYNPTYPKNPLTFGQHIRKYRKDKGLLIRDSNKESGGWRGGGVLT